MIEFTKLKIAVKDPIASARWLAFAFDIDWMPDDSDDLQLSIDGLRLEFNRVKRGRPNSILAFASTEEKSIEDMARKLELYNFRCGDCLNLKLDKEKESLTIKDKNSLEVILSK